MDNIKSIISNNKGQKDYNFLPPSVIPATYIKGKKGSTPITMEGIQYPMIALDKYGVTFQQPDQQYNYKSKGVLEMPYMPGSTKKDEEMPTAQQGGSQGDQMQQLIMMYAQMKEFLQKKSLSNYNSFLKINNSKLYNLLLKKYNKQWLNSSNSNKWVNSNNKVILSSKKQ